MKVDERKDTDAGNIEFKFIFWISRRVKCLSFHQEPGYEKMKFTDHKDMWKMVHEFVDQGYLVQ